MGYTALFSVADLHIGCVEVGDGHKVGEVVVVCSGQSLHQDGKSHCTRSACHTRTALHQQHLHLQLTHHLWILPQLSQQLPRLCQLTLGYQQLTLPA